MLLGIEAKIASAPHLLSFAHITYLLFFKGRKPVLETQVKMIINWFVCQSLIHYEEVRWGKRNLFILRLEKLTTY